jgi:proteasome lid subunit RPN8/RPN11
MAYARNVKMKERKKTMKKIMKPSLRFSPTAWAKLIFMRDCTENEVGGFGITAPDDLLLITDIMLVKQKVTIVSVSFDDTSVADFFYQQVELQRKPEQFARIWLHTHPGNSPAPSMTDTETFHRVFGGCDWSVMCILAQGGEPYAWLHFKAGPGGDINLPVSVEYGCPFTGSDFARWADEYKANIITEPFIKPKQQVEIFGDTTPIRTSDITSEDLLDEIEQMDPDERQILMDQLAIRSDFWEEYESEVF